MSSAAAAEPRHSGTGAAPPRERRRSGRCWSAWGIRSSATTGSASASRRSWQRTLPPAAGLAVEEQCTVGGLNLLDLVAGFDQLIVLDSIKTKDGRAGDWYRFDGSALRETMNLSNVHDANFATAMELGRRMGMHVPAEADIHVFAVEVRENLTFGERLSPELEEALPEVLTEMLVEIEALLEGSGRPLPAGIPDRRSPGAEAGGRRQV